MCICIASNQNSPDLKTVLCSFVGVNFDRGHYYQHTYSSAADNTVDAEDDVRPVFRPTHQNVSVGLGQRAILRCRVDNLGAKIVSES